LLTKRSWFWRWQLQACFGREDVLYYEVAADTDSHPIALVYDLDRLYNFQSLSFHDKFCSAGSSCIAFQLYKQPARCGQYDDIYDAKAAQLHPGLLLATHLLRLA
jgi:hypothetical protein